MHGSEKALLNTGCPYPGGAAVEFTQADVLQLGKLYCWGSAAVSFLVRLRDGREVFVRADKQSKDDERFLRKDRQADPRLDARSLGRVPYGVGRADLATPEHVAATVGRLSRQGLRGAPITVPASQ